MASKEEIQRQNIEEANEALGKQLSLVADIQDQMSNLISRMREKGTLDKLSLDSVKSAVSFTKNLKGEYDSLADVQKEIAKQQKLQNDILDKQKTAIEKASDGVKEEVKMLRVKEGSLTKAQNKLAKMESDKRLGKKVDEALYAQAVATVAKKEEQVNLAKEILTPEAEQIILLDKASKAIAEGNAHLDEQKRRQENLIKSSSLVNDAFGGLSKILDKMGFSKVGKIFGDASEKAKEMTYEATEGGKKTIGGFKKMGIAVKSFGSVLKSALGPLALLGMAVTLFNKIKEKAEQAREVQKQINQEQMDFGRSLGVSTSVAVKLYGAANSIGKSMGMTREQATGAAKEIYGALGGVESLSDKTMKNFMKLNVHGGVSVDTLKQMHTFAKLTGEDAGDVAQNVAKTAQEQIKGLKLNVSMREIMKSVGSVSNNVKLSFGGSAKAITEAVAKAKKLGLEMKDVEGIASSLLNIEDSLAAEMEAELLTGKELNLEKARAAALNGDQVGLMEALAEQGITQADYAGMNVIQQEALAKSLGMSRDQMADMLVTQKENTAENQDQVDFQKQGIEAMTTMASIAEGLANKNEENASVWSELAPLFEQIGLAGEQFVRALAPLATAILKPALEIVTEITQNLADWFTNFSAGEEGLERMKGVLKIIAGIYLGIKGTMFMINTYHKIEKGFMMAKKGIQTFLNAEKVKETAQMVKQGAIMAGQFLKTVGTAIMKVISSLASIPVVGWGLGIAAAAAVGTMAYKYMNDGIQGPVSGGGGYSRTMYGPEGAIKFNDKDTIVAGTNLGGSGGGGDEATVAELRRVSALLQQLLNKEGGVYIDGNKVGATIALTNYQQQ